MKLPGSLGGLSLSPGMIKQYLQGAPFPLSKQGLLQYAADKGVPREVLDLFGDLPEREYRNADEVARDMEQMQ
ncbi:MAG: DUF2795 domain-containing protein [Candidatus Zixiibacteriota bacterium]|nr:MAG: DUF2795 domain-containing protein [candidate division Zixibacteria bacterium]